MRRLLPLLMLLAVGACDQVIWSRPLDEERAKRFEPPTTNVGVLYIYRHGQTARNWAIGVSVTGTTRIELPADTFMRVEMTPGLTEVRCSTWGLTDRRQAEVAAGQIRYFEVAIRPGIPGDFTGGLYCLVSEVEAEQAQTMIRLKRRVEPL